MPAKAAFRERREPNLPDDVHLTPSQTYGVLPQAEFMARTGNAVVQNIQGQDRMKHVEPDDFIIHLRSFQGGIERSSYAGKVSTAYTVLEPSRLVVPDYFRWLLKSDAYVQELRTTTNQLRDGQSIKFRDFAKVPLPLPPSEEQRAIADYLDRETARIDTLIEEQQCLIEMLRERRAAVISSVLAPTDSWVRRRIKHIGETSLGKMLDAGRAVRDEDQPRPYVRAADVRADGSVNLENLNEMLFSDAEMEVFDLRAGDILIIEGGATVGRPGFIFKSAPGIAFQKTVNRLRVGSQTDARFVYWSMLRLYEAAYYANHYGSVSFVHLTGEKLREIELHLPPFDEQRAIAAYLDEQAAKIDTLIAETERFIELARERRSALITAAVTGQIDVREMA
nr:restriction endonuclease subunit S [Amycolatopsis aidingensis]